LGGEIEIVAWRGRALATVARSHGVSDLSRRSGVTRAGIYKALGEDGNPSFETIRSILGAMGLRLTVEPAEPLKDQRDALPAEFHAFSTLSP